MASKMASKNANFEIQVMKNGRWNTESYLESEGTAVAAAKGHLADKRCEGARVIRNWVRADGRMVEKEVFGQTRSFADDGPIRIVPVENAPAPCETPQDYFALPSRSLMNRIFRNYFEKSFVTPTELIYNYREMKRIQEKDLLVPSAVDRVAMLQTRSSGQDSKSRRDQIFQSIDRLSARARRAEALKLPTLRSTLKDVVDRLAIVESEEDCDYLAMVVLSRDLGNVRNWLGKLDRLCRLALDEGDPHSLELLDGVIADVLGANVVQEILGWQPSLAMAIVRMLDLADGRFPADKSDAGESAELLNVLLRDGKLPASRLCLIDRAYRQLKSANPLYRNDPGKEAAGFATVLERLITPTGLLHGPETAEALTVRAGRLVEEGGAAGRRAAIQTTFHAMPDRAYGLIYLCDLAQTDHAKDHGEDIAVLVERVFQTRGLAELCQRNLSAKERMERATAAHRSMQASPWEPALKNRLADHIDGVLEKYLIDEQVVEKLDHHESPLRDRAIRLVQFCASGILPEGRALARARERIRGLLRGANFDAHFVDGIADPVKAQKALRDFHQLLLRAGFGA